jgi:glutamyl-tRNA(Gln) amidotransferase subunit D
MFIVSDFLILYIHNQVRRSIQLSTEGKKMDIDGYKGRSLELLSEGEVSVGDTINVQTNDGQFTGILMPRYELADKNHVVIKLKSGYNIGIKTANIQLITKIMQESDQNISVGTIRKGYLEEKLKEVEILPKIALISTGGTIASKVDYRTGGVSAALSASELYASIPELRKYASIDPEVLLNEYSENLKPEHWTMIANKIAEKIKSNMYRGIIVSHGTDTMHYTASALSFALQNLPIPVVIVGAQRSSDRPSSDAALNLISATIFVTKSELSGVFVTMHASPSDDTIACHVGTRVRKNHTSRRDAFESIDITPVAMIKGDRVEIQKEQSEIKLHKRNDSSRFLVKPDFNGKAILLKYHPGFDPYLITYAIMSGYKAIIVEGTGLGHISRECFPQIQNAVESGVMICMTSQCIWGRIRMTVYDTGRDLLNIGVIPLSDMTSETAIVKAMWVLANTKEIESAKKMMQENIANEISRVIPITNKRI